MAACAPRSERRVVVVGAGIAGAAAAHHIATSKPSIEVLVVEARDRVGGRMHSQTGTVDGLGPVRVELGGQWIEGGKTNPVYSLAKKYGLRIGSENDRVLQFSATGRRYSGAELEAASSTYEKLKNKALAYAESRDTDISVDAAFRAVDEALYLTPFVQNQVAQDFDFSLGSLNDLSAFHYDDSEYDDDEDILVLDGYDSIPKGLMNDAVAAGAKLRLGFEVSSISQARGQGVTVEGRAGSGGEREALSADAVLVTVPLGVLKEGLITFTPPLPQRKQVAMSRLGMAHGAKVALFYKTKFWDARSDGYFVEDEAVPGDRGKFMFWRNLAHPEGQNALLGYAVGEYAWRRNGHSEALVSDAQAKVGAMFPASRHPTNAPLASWVKDWSTDPYSRGSYSYPKAGSKGIVDYDTLALPEGRVFFAGEHTHGRYRATVHGAYLSGQREAKRILKSI